jgi:hypothetical protein
MTEWSALLVALISGAASGLCSMLVFVGTVRTDLRWLKENGSATAQRVESLPCRSTTQARCPYVEK